MRDLDHFKRVVGKVTFPYPVMLAGGIVKTAEQVEALLETEVIPEWGSITTDMSPGNGGHDYHAAYDEVGDKKILRFTQNSLGLPNPGMEYVEKHASSLVQMYEDQGKPLVLNVSGNGVDDSLRLLKRALACGFRVITVNGACPNKKGQPILCDDRDAVNELFERAEAEIGATGTVILWKVSNGMRRPTLQHNKDHIARSRVFNGIITGNTVPNTLAYRADKKPTIMTDNGMTRGGMAGPTIMPIALDHTAFCAEDMPEGKVVIGCGGARTFTDVHQFFHAGATMVQINSAYREADENPTFMRGLLHDLHIMRHRA